MYNKNFLLEEDVYTRSPQSQKKQFASGSRHTSGLTADRITDVLDFFLEITESYLSVEKQAKSILHQIPHTDPIDLLAACTDLRQTKSDIKSKDEHMIAIITLAGREISSTPLIHDYQEAFNKATIASNSLHRGLSELKLEILQEALGVLPNE